MTVHFTTETADWPTPEPVAADRVVSGSPTVSTLVTATTPTADTGLWRATEGEFTTDHTGYVEFFHIVEGTGSLVRDDGEVTELKPGVSVTMADGWTGRWVVASPIVKTFGILRNNA